jgi:DnaK suppressor protein
VTAPREPAPDQPDSVRRRLETERGAGESALADLGAQLEAVRSANAASNGDDEHDPEGSTIAFEAAQLGTLIQRGAEHLAEIDRAITRLGTAGYGICVRCQELIGEPRLAALPATDLCVRCAGRRR